MSHKDRNRVQVPRELPDWMDGPLICKRAREDGVSYRVARNRLYYDGQVKRFRKLLGKKTR